MASDKRTILEIRPISELKPHEETVGPFSGELAARIQRERVQRDPIFVDDKTGVVLDGMHRLAAFKTLGIPNIVVCAIDYSSPGVKLYRWCRAVARPSRALFDRLKREFRVLDEPTDLTAQDLRSRGVVLVYRGKAYHSSGRIAMKDIPDAIRRFDRAVTESGRMHRFVDEASLTKAAEEDELILITPKFQKRHVIEAGKTGSLLPPKSTLHVFPLRPLGIDYPLEFLRAGRNELGQHVAARGQRILKGPALHGGRLYRERILVFDR